jgi:hypothetical protein
MGFSTSSTARLPDNRFTLEGHDLIIIEVGHTDTDESSVLYVPDLGLVVARDVIESANGGRDAWRKAIDTVKALRPDIAAPPINVRSHSAIVLQGAHLLLCEHETSPPALRPCRNRFSAVIITYGI